jgi:hypothetical protein
MALSLTFDELLRYTGEERDKWRDWFVQHPDAVAAPVQPSGRLPTVGKLVDHIFLAERRNLQRGGGAPGGARPGRTGRNRPPPGG